jgi:hypothetical protein
MRYRKKIVHTHLLYLDADTLKFQHGAIIKHVVWNLNASRIPVHLLDHTSNRQNGGVKGEGNVLNKCKQRQNTNAMKPVVEVALNSVLDRGRRLEED